MQIQNSKLFNFKKVDNAIKGDALAKEMMIFADKNSSAVSKAEFQEKLDKMEKLSTKDLIKFIKSFDKDESVIELICDEVGDDKKTRKEACKKVMTALVNKAKELGIDTKDFELQFNEELGSQFGFMGKYIKTEKLDNIVNAITQSIENRANLTQDEIQQIQNTSAEEGENQTNTIIENRLEKAYADFGERVDNNGEMTDKHEVQIPILDKNGNPTGEFETKIETYNGQLQQDGIAADIADGVSRIWGSENTAAKVRRDLKIANSELQELKEASIEGEEAYKAKFKEIFGIEYDYANMVAYQKAEQTYINASQYHEFEMMFKRELKTLLSPAPLREETESVSADPSTSIMITNVTATKEQVFEREFNKLAEYLGEQGVELLNKSFEEKGVQNGTLEEKFEVLKEIAKSIFKQIHAGTLEAGGGKDFETVKTMYENSYKAAYGVENDIMKRVTDYNTSQQVGAGVVKAAKIMAASLTAAFSGVGLVGVAAITAGTTVGVEVLDRGTSGKALNALREDGVGAYIKTANDDIDWEATLKQAVISGGAVLIGGAVAKGVSVVMEGAKPAAQAIAQFGGDVVFDAGWEYLTTGKITIEGMVFSVLLSAAGNIVAMKQMSKAADAGRVVDDAVTTQTAKTLKDGVDFKTRLADIKGPDGQPFLTKSEIDNLLENCQHGFVTDGAPIPDFEARIMAVLSNPEEIASLADWKSRSAGVWRAIQDPLQSTVDLNPAAFGVKPKATATAGGTDFASKLADIKGPDGQPFLTKSEIDNLLENCQHGLVTDGKPIPDFEARIMAVLNNPEEIASLADWKSRSAGVWRAIQDPLQSTVDLNPAAFGVKPKATATAGGTDFASKLADIKGPDGQPFLTKSEIDNLLENCQRGFVTDGAPIPDFEARIMAVLNNPEEIASLADWKSRSAGVWRAIQDPLQSTVDLNPAVFGVKSKATAGVGTTVPTDLNHQIQAAARNSNYDTNVVLDMMQKYPDVVDKLAVLKAPDGSQIFSAQDISDILFNCQDVVKNNPERMFDIFNNATDLKYILESNNRAYAFFKASYPLSVPQVPTASAVKPTSNQCVLPQNMKFDSGNIGNVPVRVASGDITTVKADAYLVPEFQMGASDGGVGGAIWRSGGGKGLEAYDDIVKAQGRQDFGAVHITESGGGNSQKLIHAVTVGSGAENEFEVVQKAVYNALKQAEEQGLSSVAMPALGTGIIGNLTDEQSAQAMMSAIRQFSNEGGQMDVTLVIYGNSKGYNSFTNTMNTGSYASAVSTIGAREIDPARFLMGMANDGTDIAATQAAKVTDVPVSVVDDIPILDDVDFTPTSREQLLIDLHSNSKTLIKDANNRAKVNYRIDRFVDVVEQLHTMKMPDGSPRFTLDDINNMLLNIRETEWENPTRIFDAIKAADKYGYEKGAFGVWKCLYY